MHPNDGRAIFTAPFVATAKQLIHCKDLTRQANPLCSHSVYWLSVNSENNKTNIFHWYSSFPAEMQCKHIMTDTVAHETQGFHILPCHCLQSKPLFSNVLDIFLGLV